MKWERVQVKNVASETPETTPKAARVYVRRRRAGQGPGRKWGHTCNAVKERRLMYVFGGFGRDNCQMNDLYVFDTTTQKWSKPAVKGTSPSPRDSHTCTTVGHRLFVFGGSDGSRPLKDLHILDTDLNRWSSPPTRGEGPSAREGHSAALIDTRLLVFGGCGRSPDDDTKETTSNDLYILDTESLTWAKAATRGIAPAPRDSHTCSSYGNKFIVLGGQGLLNSNLSDVHILDADTLVWKELSTTGQKLPPRSGHTTVALGKYLFVFGGYDDDQKLFDDLHVLNVESGVWTRKTTAGEAPSPRFSSAGDWTDPDERILFIGGCNEDLDAIDDMFYLYTELASEKSEDEECGRFTETLPTVTSSALESYLCERTRSLAAHFSVHPQRKNADPSTRSDYVTRNRKKGGDYATL